MIPFIINLLNLPVTRKEVLKRAKKFKEYGLCHAISYALDEYDTLHVTYNWLNICFPKFTRENALQFGADNKDDWWWEPKVWDTGRMDFLDWLIDQYKDDKTDLRKL